MLDKNLDRTETIVLDSEVAYPNLEIFLNNMEKFLDYFEENKIPCDNLSDSILSYPKYLTSPDLFQLQLNDASFRKTVMTQFLIVLKSFLRPISQAQKKCFVFNEKEKKIIKELINKIKEVRKFYDSNMNTERVMREEEFWEKWKETACPSFEKFPTSEIKKLVDESKEKAKNNLTNSKNKIRTRSIFRIDNLSTYDFNKYFDLNMNELKEIKSNLIFSEKLKSDNPFIGSYIERIMKDSDAEMEIEENDKIFNSDPVSIIVFNSHYENYFRLLDGNF